MENIFAARRTKGKVIIGWVYDHNYTEKGLNDHCKTGGVTGWMRQSVDQDELKQGGYCAGILSNQVIFGSAGYTANWHCEHLNLGSINVQCDGIKIWMFAPANQKKAMDAAILSIINQVCM